MRGFSWTLGWRPKKKGLHSNNWANIHEFCGEDHKRSLLQNLHKKQFLPRNSGVITSILRVSDLELHSSGTECVTFFRAQSSLWGGHNSRFGGISSDLGEHGPGMIERFDLVNSLWYTAQYNKNWLFDFWIWTNSVLSYFIQAEAGILNLFSIFKNEFRVNIKLFL